MGLFIRRLLVISLVCAVRFTAAARNEEQLQFISAPARGDPELSRNTLNTYYFDTVKPSIELSSRGSSRAERTAVTVKLDQASVSRYMTVVTPRASGMTHAVSNTWQALKVGVVLRLRPAADLVELASAAGQINRQS